MPAHGPVSTLTGRGVLPFDLLLGRGDAYADRVADANRASEERSAAVIDEALKKEEERYRQYSEELERTAAKRREQAKKLDVYVDPRDRHD